MPATEPELVEALLRLRQYGIMKGETIKFYPYNELNGESCLAVLGRSFFDLQDLIAPGQHRYQPYVDYFTTNGLIPANRPYIGKSIPRKEIFLLCKGVLEKKGLIG